MVNKYIHTYILLHSLPDQIFINFLNIFNDLASLYFCGSLFPDKTLFEGNCSSTKCSCPGLI